MNRLNAVDYAVMVAYFAVLILVGLWFSRKKEEKGTEDYLLGGRRMPVWAVGISIFMAVFSTISLVAGPGEAFNHGLTMVLLGIPGTLFGIAAFHVFTRFYFRIKTFTPYEYLEHRFDYRARIIGGFTFWLIRFAYLGIVLFSCAKVFEGASNWPVWLTIIVMGVIGTVYTTLGGMKAVIWTNVFQFTVLFVGVVWVILKCTYNVPGGITGTIIYAFEHGRGFQGIGEPGFFGFSPYVRLSFWGLLFFHFYDQIFMRSADQLGIQQLLSTSSYKEATKSFYTFLLIGLPFGPLLYFLGLAIFAFYGHHPVNEDLRGDTVLFRFIATELPRGVSAIVLSGMLAAAMSTINGCMNSLAAVATKDVYLRYFRPQSTDHQQLSCSRIVTIGVGASAVVMGLLIAFVSEYLKKETFLEVGTIWMSLAAVVPPMYLVGVTSTRANGTHIFWGAILGAVTTVILIVWYILSKNTDQPLSFVWVGTFGSVVMTIFCYLPAIFRFKEVDTSKTNGLTLWTLKND